MPETSWSEIVAAAYNVYVLSEERLGVGLGVLVADNDWLSHALSKLGVSAFVLASVAISAMLYSMKLFVEEVIHEVSPLE